MLKEGYGIVTGIVIRK